MELDENLTELGKKNGRAGTGRFCKFPLFTGKNNGKVSRGDTGGGTLFLEMFIFRKSYFFNKFDSNTHYLPFISS